LQSAFAPSKTNAASVASTLPPSAVDVSAVDVSPTDESNDASLFSCVSSPLTHAATSEALDVVAASTIQK